MKRVSLCLLTFLSFGFCGLSQEVNDLLFDVEPMLPEDEVALIPDSIVIDGNEGSDRWEEKKMVFIIEKQLILNHGQLVNLPQVKEEKVTLQIDGDRLQVQAGGKHVLEYVIYEKTGEAMTQEGERCVISPAIRAVRISGERLDQMVVTDYSIQIVSSGFQSNDVIVRYGKKQ